MRIVKGPCFIDIGPPSPSLVRAVGKHTEFNKNHRDTKFTEKDYICGWGRERI